MRDKARVDMMVIVMTRVRRMRLSVGVNEDLVKIRAHWIIGWREGG